MPGSTFPTQRSVGQVLRRHTPGSLLYVDEHGLIARVTKVKGERDISVDPTRLHAQVIEFLRRWQDRGGDILNMDPEVGVRDLVPITPSKVEWEAYPHTYRCVDDACQVLHDGTDARFTGRCRRCGKNLRQLTLRILSSLWHPQLPEAVGKR